MSATPDRQRPGDGARCGVLACVLAMRQGSPVQYRRCPRNCERRARGIEPLARFGGPGRRRGRRPRARRPPHRRRTADDAFLGRRRSPMSRHAGRRAAIRRPAAGDAGPGRRPLGQEPLCRDAWSTLRRGPRHLSARPAEAGDAEMAARIAAHRARRGAVLAHRRGAAGARRARSPPRRATGRPCWSIA